MTERWDTLLVDGGSMRSFVAAPDGAGPYPAVIVIQHAAGVDQFVQTMTRRLGEASYIALSPDLYHREDPDSSDDAMRRMSRLRDANIEKDVGAAIAHLKSMPNVRAGRIGITGFCMGGRVAYMIAARNPDIRATVVFYGGNIMVPWGEGRAPFDDSAGINCPVLGLFGADDANPSPADVAKIDAELTRLGKLHEFHSYAGAGHAFMTEGRPSYRPEAAAEAWKRCVDWLNRHLVA